MNADNRSRTELLNRVSRVSFAVNELNLYLNTHPQDSNALDMFNEVSQKRLALLDEFAKKYGPLIVDYADENCNESWNWIQMPWPWQEGGC